MPGGHGTSPIIPASQDGFPGSSCLAGLALSVSSGFDWETLLQRKWKSDLGNSQYQS